MNLSKNKLVAGVVGLIAVVGIVNTQAIVSLANYVKGGDGGDKVTFSADGQEAQVFGTTQANNCLKVYSPLGTRTSSNLDGEFNGQQYFVEDYLIGVSLQNTCSYKIYVVNPSSFWPTSATLTNPLAFGGVDPVYGDITSESAMTDNFKVGLSSFPGITTYTNSIPSEFLTYTSPSLMVENLVPEFSSGVQGDNISLQSSQTVGIPTGSSFNAYGLNPKVKKKFWYFVSVVQPGLNSNNYDQNFSFTKVALKSLRWFKESSLSDSLLHLNEIKTLNIPSDLVYRFETSGVRIGDVDSSDGCAEGTIIGYDSSGNPIYCGDEIGEGDCVEGTVIDYNKDGTPIFCGE